MSLPRTKKALYLHFNKVNYQFRQWKITLNLHHELSDQTDHVWVNDDNGSLGIHWADCKPVEFVTCSSQNVGHVVGSLLIYHAHICLCKSCKNSNKDTNTDIEDTFDDDVYDSHDEYNEDEYESGEEENGGKLFLDVRMSHEKKIMTKAKGNKKFLF